MQVMFAHKQISAFRCPLEFSSTSVLWTYNLDGLPKTLWIFLLKVPKDSAVELSSFPDKGMAFSDSHIPWGLGQD